MIDVNSVWNGDIVKSMALKLAGKSSFEIGLAVEGQAKLLAPVDTGRLRGSIMTASGMGQRSSSKSGDEISPPIDPFQTYVGTSVDYAPYMEYGTVKTSAQPYLRPALDIVRAKASGIVKVQANREFAEYLNPKDIFLQTNEAFTE